MSGSSGIEPFVPGMRRIPSASLNAMLGSCQRADGLRQPPHVSHLGGFWTGILDAAGQVAYTDERYWVKITLCTNAAGDEHAAMTVVARTGTDPRTRQTTATNLAELADGTHNLAAGTHVWGWWMVDAQGVVHLIFQLTGTKWTDIATMTKIDTGAQLFGYPLEYDDGDNLTYEARYLWKFPAAVDGTRIRGIRHEDVVVAIYHEWDASDAVPSGPQYAYAKLYLITADFTPATVTWATQPAAALIDNGIQIEFDTTAIPVNGGGSAEGGTSAEWFFWDDDGLGTGGTTYYGVMMRAVVNGEAGVERGGGCTPAADLLRVMFH